MSYTYSIQYELTEALTPEQLQAMRRIVELPWTPPPGYQGEVLKATIWQTDCDCTNYRCQCVNYPPHSGRGPMP